MFYILGGDGKEYGPVSVAKIQEWMNAGRANLQTKARRPNDTEWRTLGEMPEFNGAPALAAAEPPVASSTLSPVPSLRAASPGEPMNQRPLAGLGLRFGAAFIDGFLKSLCLIPLSLVFVDLVRISLENPSQPLTPEQVSEAIMPAYMQCLPLYGILALVQVTLLCLRSQTIGKLLLRIQIVEVQTGQPGGPVRAFLLRALIPTMIEFIPFIGFVFWLVDTCFIFRADRRCIHDLLAGTRVVKI
jgi:uncharacterized RDD family membrane protein YckC